MRFLQVAKAIGGREAGSAHITSKNWMCAAPHIILSQLQIALL
jgi:hypothetical protein